MTEPERTGSAKTIPGDDDSKAMQTGGWIGCGVGLVAAIQLIHGNRTLLDPMDFPLSAGLVGAAFALVAAVLGAIAAVAATRLARLPRRRIHDAGPFAAFLATGLLSLASGFALGSIVLVLALRLRRRFLPGRSRLDEWITILLLLACVGAVGRTPRPRVASTWTHPVAAGTPAAGSIPVTITVHREPGFPEVPAVHAPTRGLASASPGRAAALWSGIAPARTPAGTGTPRSLRGGGTIAWTPPHVLSRALVPLLARPMASDDPRVSRRPLEEMVRAAGIPILRESPTETDPPLWLRVLESSEAPSRDVAESAAQAGAWIDISLGNAEGIALGGKGVRITPLETSISVLDVTPTALHLLGLAVPRESDGRVIFEALDPAGPGYRAPRYRTRAMRSSRTRRTTSFSFSHVCRRATSPP